jgi:serine/threonine protein kinase
LQRAHDGGVRHGDLTPGSVLLRDGAVPVLAGVEPAVLRDYRATDDATPVHAAPETVRADGAVDDRTDVYGLGSILYAALAGAPPFPTRRGEQEHERLARVLLDKPAAPPGPAWLAELVLAMLAKEPASRPALHRAIGLLAADGAEPGQRDTHVREAAPESEPAEHRAPGSGRHPAPWALTAACLAVVIAVVAGVLLVWPVAG